MRALTLPLLLVLVLALGACAGAGPTPYQPAERPGAQGFTDEQLAEDRFRITVVGNALTPRERVEDYLLFRAAELTLEQGFDHFILQERQTDSETVRYYDGWGPGWGPAWGPGWAWRPYWGGYYGGSSYHGFGMGLSTGGGGGRETRYTTTAVVLMRHGEPVAGIGPTYDARSVIDRLQPVARPAPTPQ